MPIPGRVGLALGACMPLLVPVPVSAQSRDTTAQTPAIACAEPGTILPNAEVPCRILARVPVAAFPPGPLVWMLDTAATLSAAQAQAGPTGLALEADGRIWLLTVGPRRGPPHGLGRVAEVGPLPLPPARRYEIVIAFAKVPPGAHSASHTHSGPEAWYVVAGAQCVETARGVFRATAGHGTIVPADTPMHLTATGPDERRAFFLVVHDAARAWDIPSQWQPTGACRAA